MALDFVTVPVITKELAFCILLPTLFALFRKRSFFRMCELAIRFFAKITFKTHGHHAMRLLYHRLMRLESSCMGLVITPTSLWLKICVRLILCLVLRMMHVTIVCFLAPMRSNEKWANLPLMFMRILLWL